VTGGTPPVRDAFTVDRFLPRVGEVFHARAEGGEPVALLLSEIERLVADRPERRERVPFSLLFHAPRGVALEQRIHWLEGPGIEPFECFLVPIGPDAHGMRFEAIFA
jgi:hypothetical protein